MVAVGQRLRLLCFSDVHGKEDIVKAFIDDVRGKRLNFDAMIAAGDIGNPQKPEVFSRILSALTTLGKPVLYVRGNWDVNIGEVRVRGVTDLEEGPFEVGEYVIVGHGRKTRPFEVPSDRRVVLVTHYPPYSIMDRGKKLDAPQQTNHSGLIKINYLVHHYRPVVHIFGHSHSFGGIDLSFNGITYVNAARLDRVSKNGQYIGNYCVVELERGAVRVEWYFLNGVWRRCSCCNKRVHLPVGWSVCRKCARKRDLRYAALPPEYGRLRVEVDSIRDGGRSLLFSGELEIPVETLADEDAYMDFVDAVIREAVVRELLKIYDKVLILPKDKVIEFYGNNNDDLIIPFSEYLFSRDVKVMGRRLHTVMRLYALDKRVHVIWAFRREGYERYARRLAGEFVLFSDRILSQDGERLLRMLHEGGFRPLVFRMVYAPRVERDSTQPGRTRRG